MRESEPFQVMPPLSAEELQALREDIAANGVLVPITVDQHGRVLDGHHRKQLADELGVSYDTHLTIVADDEEARGIALKLNLARRHLTREQKRDLIAAEIERDPSLSDREIARRLACSPSTVGTVRHRGVSNLDTPQTVTIPATIEVLARLGESREFMKMVDKALEKMVALQSEDLARFTWHWTLDESNPDRVSIREFARSVGRSEATIETHANGYAASIESKSEPNDT